MNFLVREEGKSGGYSCPTGDDAVKAAVAWRMETYIRCEIYVWQPGNPMFDKPMLSVTHTLEADNQWANWRRVIEEMESEGFHR